MSNHKDIFIVLEIALFVLAAVFFIASLYPVFNSLGWTSLFLYGGVIFIEIHRHNCWICN